jgi:hypothetical protein
MSHCTDQSQPIRGGGPVPTYRREGGEEEWTFTCPTAQTNEGEEDRRGMDVHISHVLHRSVPTHEREGEEEYVSLQISTH